MSSFFVAKLLRAPICREHDINRINNNKKETCKRDSKAYCKSYDLETTLPKTYIENFDIINSASILTYYVACKQLTTSML